MAIPASAPRQAAPSRVAPLCGKAVLSLPPMAFVAWHAILALSWIGAVDYWAQIELIVSGSTTRSQILGFSIFAVAAAVALALSPSARAGFVTDGPALFLVGLFFLQMLTAPWSIDPAGSLQYAMVFLVATFALRLIWLCDPLVLRRWFMTTAFAIIVCMCILAWQLGINDRFIGGIRPNTIGAMAFAAAWLALAGGGYLSSVAIAAALVFIYISNSRIFMLCFVVMIVVYRTVRASATKRLVFVALVGLCLSITAWVDLATSGRITDFVVEDVGRISDPDRGIGSGATGRVQRWENGLAILPESPLFGFGFRTRGESDMFLAADQSKERVNAHAGIINLSLDAGFIGVVLLLMALVGRVIALTMLISKVNALAGEQPAVPRNQAIRRQRLATAAAAGIAGIIAYGVHLVIEPTYLNLGNSFIIVALMFLSGQPRPPQVGHPKW